MRILTIVPHQDDEIILCGSLFGGLLAKGDEVFVVFTTNGDYNEEVRYVRMEEALRASEMYGISEDHVIFMGYANEYDSNDPHIYNAPDGVIVHSQYGNAETYGLSTHPEYCYAKHGFHHAYTRKNFYEDLYEIVNEIRPELIFSTGEEIHPDHSANSLLLDEVVGNIMRSDAGYRPTVFKKPEYSTAWFGAKDYNGHNNPSAIFDYKHNSVSVNGAGSQFFDPYLRWNDRVRIPADLDAAENVESALKIYDSQNAMAHFSMLVNSDVVFWQRRTDSISYASRITVSSGNPDFLNDFKRNDTSDIRRRKTEVWKQDASIWRPEEGDDFPKIKIAFGEPVSIDRIILFQEFNPVSAIEECSISAEGYGEIWRGRLCRWRETVVSCANIRSKEIKIKILRCSEKMQNVGLAEIEVYPQIDHKTRFLKLMVNGNFAYEYHVMHNQRQNVKVYSVNDVGETNYHLLRDYRVEVVDDCGEYVPQNKVFDKNENIITTAFQDKTINIRVFDEKGCTDSIKIVYPKESAKRELYFIGTPNHWNSGDHFIAQATVDFLRKYCPDALIHEVQISEFDQMLPQLKEMITRDDLIVMQGGGNMGDVYPTNERIRRKVFGTFPYNCIIVFPETVYYTKTKQGQYEQLASQKIYSDVKNLILCAREKESFCKMKALYPSSKVILVPDIVCSMKMPIIQSESRNGASLFFRTDGEKAVTEEINKSVIEELERRDITCRYRDMIYNSNRGYSGKANRHAIIRTKLLEIRGSKIVVTDRLHAMILCVMTGTPCVVFCGYNHKIPSTYETWFRDVPYVRLVAAEEEIGKAIDEVMSAKTETDKITESFLKHFDELDTVLKGDCRLG